MRHYVLTRSAFGPAWHIDANRRRLDVTRAVTARLMARQTVTAWTWIVLLDERDPLLRDRLAVYADHAPAFCPIIRKPSPAERASRHAGMGPRQRIAAADYKAAWRAGIPCDDTVLMTRLDDDDGLAPDALARYQGATVSTRTALMLPSGVHVWRGRYAVVRHARNAMHTLVTPPGDTACVYDYGHTLVDRMVPVKVVDEEPGWLWVRHADTISGARNPRQWARDMPAAITSEVRALFPIDWTALERAWTPRS